MNPITRVKKAALSRAALELAESGGAAARVAGKAAKGAFRTAGDVGEAFASGLGANPTAGRVAGQAALIGGGVVGADKARREYQQWKWNHNFLG